MDQTPFDWKEISIRLDSRVIADLTSAINVRLISGTANQLEFVVKKLLEAISRNDPQWQLRYKSNDPDYRAG